MNDKFFLDTTILIYAVTDEDLRANIAKSLIVSGAHISVQGLNEFAAVARRKLRRSWPETIAALAEIRAIIKSVAPVTSETHDRGLLIAERFGFHIYDSLMIAAALELGCTTLYSEDMQHGQVIDGLTIRNPFLSQIDQLPVQEGKEG